MSLKESLMALVPPEFGRQCVMCGTWRAQLPWQVEMGGSWGPVCRSCGKRLLTRVLRWKLPKSFSGSQFVDVVCSFGVGRREAELILGDFLEERSIFEAAAGLFWPSSSESDEVVKPLVAGAERKPVFRRKTGEEIFLGCVRLSQEIRSRTELSHTRREPADQGER